MKKENKPVKVFRFVYAVNFVIQAGISMVCPGGLIIFAGWMLKNRWGMGQWVMITAIILGTLIGVYSMFYYIVKMTGRIDPTQYNEKGGINSEGLYGRSGGEGREKNRK